MGKSKEQALKDKRIKVEDKKRKISEKIGKACAFATVAFVFAGCATSEPASRVTRADYGDIIVRLDGSYSNTVTVTIGDGAFASADSKGSTESTTANPTLDVRPTTTVNYGLTSSSSAGTDWISQLTAASAQGLASWLKSDNTAKTEMIVTKTDGTTEKVTCKDGVCTPANGETITCKDGVCTPE